MHNPNDEADFTPMQTVGVLQRIWQNIHAYNRKVISDSNLKGYHMRYIVSLHRSGPLPAKELSNTLRSDKGHTSRVIAELSDLGLVTRDKAPRMANVELTDKGREVAEEIFHRFDDLWEDIIGDVGSENFQELINSLNKIDHILCEKLGVEYRPVLMPPQPPDHPFFDHHNCRNRKENTDEDNS